MADPAKYVYYIIGNSSQGALNCATDPANPATLNSYQALLDTFLSTCAGANYKVYASGNSICRCMDNDLYPYFVLPGTHVTLPALPGQAGWAKIPPLVSPSYCNTPDAFTIAILYYAILGIDANGNPVPAGSPPSPPPPHYLDGGGASPIRTVPLHWANLCDTRRTRLGM